MTEGTYIQTAFVSGELSPAMFGRTEHVKYKFGASTMRNGFVNFQGGYASRPGLAYIGMCKQGAPNNGGAGDINTPPKDIPFQVSVGLGYVLEFGDFYMRPKFRGSYVTESAITLTSIDSSANFTATAHGLSVGDWIFDSGNIGFNGLTWVVNSVPTANTFTVTDLFGITISAATASTGGAVSRIYTVVSPYAAVDLLYLKYTQSADEMSLTCWNQDTLTEYPPYDLVMNSANNWVFTETTYSSSIVPPATVTSTAQSSTTLDTWYSYVVTAIDANSGDESIASIATQIQNNDISVNAGSNTLAWSQVPNAASYNVYGAPPYYSTSGTAIPQIGVPYGYLGSAIGTTFVDNNITADYTKTPPLHNNPFSRGAVNAVRVTVAGSSLSASTVNYTVTTSTGSGFSGIPIISSTGSLAGFVVNNSGQDYAPTDTMSIVTGGTAASGTYTFGGSNPTSGQTVIINGVTWTFQTVPTGPAQTKIQVDVNTTVQQLASDLASSGNTLLTQAKYSASTDVLTVTFGQVGTPGNAYTLAVGTYTGGVVSGATLSGGTNGTASNARASLIIGPESGTYPGAVAYFQERRAYGSTENNPDTYFMSQPGAFTNMDASIPAVDSDAIIGTPWAQQVNGIQFMTPMPGGLVIFTGAGAWQLSGGNNVAITPADQDAQPQSRYGCSSTVPPIPINFHILYVRENNGIIYDLVYNFWANIYTGNDLTVYSSHLFNGYEIDFCAYAEKPYKLVWAARNDGTLLSMTYIAEQEEQGWARHDTNGLFECVCSIEEPPVDAVYVIVKRFIRGQWLYYSERFDNRLWLNSEDCFCVDAGLSYPMSFPDATLIASTATGSSNITSTDVIFGGSGYIAPTAEAVDSSGQGTGATFSVTVVAGIITAVVPLTTGNKYVAGSTQIIIRDSLGSGAVVNPVITNFATFTASSSVFSSGNVGDVIRMGNGRATVVSYASATQIVANITLPITAVLNNNPNNIPLPASPDDWSIATPTTVVTNLNHLEGMTVTGLADGGVIVPQTVINGQITLQEPASAINVGLSFLPQLQTLYLDTPTPNTIQTKRKNIPSVGLRVHDSRGASVGSNQPDASTQPGQVNVPWTNMVDVKERNQLITMGQPIPLQTKDYFVNIGVDWNVKGQIAVQQPYPLPLNADALVLYYNVGDKGDAS